MQAARRDAAALGLVPLDLYDRGAWDPTVQYWGEEGEPIESWAKPIIARGPRPSWEFEQVIPGTSPDIDVDDDPIVQAVELRRSGAVGKARDLLMGLLAEDLRCLDAHAHLGHQEFDHDPKTARRHHETGMEIGMLTLGDGFDGVLNWGWLDNRPYLRCMFGVGLCRWRLGDLHGAADVFRRMLWINPGDNQGVRFNLAEIEAGRTWEQVAAEEQ